jgi:hypothetical protein
MKMNNNKRQALLMELMNWELNLSTETELMIIKTADSQNISLKKALEIVLTVGAQKLVEISKEPPFANFDLTKTYQENINQMWEDLENKPLAELAKVVKPFEPIPE